MRENLCFFVFSDIFLIFKGTFWIFFFFWIIFVIFSDFLKIFSDLFQNFFSWFFCFFIFLNFFLIHFFNLFCLISFIYLLDHCLLFILDAFKSAHIKRFCITNWMANKSLIKLHFTDVSEFISIINISIINGMCILKKYFLD